MWPEVIYYLKGFAMSGLLNFIGANLFSVLVIYSIGALTSGMAVRLIKLGLGKLSKNIDHLDDM